MSTGTAECETLEEIDLDKVPPCAIWHGTWTAGVYTKTNLCGKPAFVRIKFSCNCGRVSIVFVCKDDYEAIKAGGYVGCNGCAGVKFKWTEV
jgi:hypothetical protein